MPATLVTVKKHGQPKLRIHPDALAQHLKLGWHEAEDDKPVAEEKSTPAKTPSVKPKDEKAS